LTNCTHTHTHANTHILNARTKYNNTNTHVGRDSERTKKKEVGIVKANIKQTKQQKQ